MAGIRVLAGTNELEAICAPLYIYDPSIMIVLSPIYTSSSIIQLIRVDYIPIYTLWPMFTLYGIPIGNKSILYIVLLSFIIVLFPILIG